MSIKIESTATSSKTSYSPGQIALIVLAVVVVLLIIIIPTMYFTFNQQETPPGPQGQLFNKSYMMSSVNNVTNEGSSLINTREPSIKPIMVSSIKPTIMESTVKPTIMESTVKPTVKPTLKPTLESVDREPTTHYFRKIYEFSLQNQDNCFIPDFKSGSIPFVTEDVLNLYPTGNTLYSKQFIVDIKISIELLNEILDQIYEDQENVLVVITDINFNNGPRKVILVYDEELFNNYKFITKEEYSDLSKTLYNNYYELWVPYFLKYKYDPKYYNL